jgi:sulfur relay (sulfurtransferase) DsrC/TusE family protein
MFKIEVVARIYYTCNLSNEDEKKVINYIKENYEEFKFMSEKDKILKAVEELYSNNKIDVYKNSTESDMSTEEFNWSEFEERDAEDIISGK